ncbi:MAG: serine/threonine protein kinase [Candidatus Sumerlaeaceae bacterium]|nr:serine/threonine protein kinase [Candidatus Sumerlaeaceae bacterium]
MTTKMPDIIAGKYEVVELVGRGGMGTVFKAVQQSLNRVVAIKMLSEELASDIEFRARFQQEATVVARMNHPNIVQVYDIEPHGHTFCIIMEYVEGKSLQSLIDQKAGVSEQAVVSIGAQIARALDYAHAMKVIHRDVKPDNILVTADGVAKITDFGIARFMESKFKTQTGICMGTPKFMSPEQVTGKNVDGQSDLYSLGICLYYCLTGQTPFDGENPISIATKHLYEAPDPVATLNPAISHALDTVVMQSLEKSKSARFETGEAMAKALEGTLQSKSQILLSAVGQDLVPEGATKRMAAKDLQPSSDGRERDVYVSSDNLETLPETPSGIRRIVNMQEPEILGDLPSNTTNVYAVLSGTAAPATETRLPAVHPSDGRGLGGLVKRFWPAGVAALLVACGLAFAIWGNGGPVPVPNGNGMPTDDKVYIALTELRKQTDELVGQKKIEDALQLWNDFQRRNPDYQKESVAARIDWLTAQLPVANRELLAQRRHTRGMAYYNVNPRLAHAYLLGAQDLYKGMQKPYNGDSFIKLLELKFSANTPSSEEDRQQAKVLADEAQKMILKTGDKVNDAVVDNLISAISHDPENFQYWLALARYYRQTGYLDDTRVLLNHIARIAPADSEERKSAATDARQLES